MRVGKRSAFKRIFSRYRTQIIVGAAVLILAALMICSAIGVIHMPFFHTLARYTIVPVKTAFDLIGDSIEILTSDTEEIESQLLALQKENARLRMENEQIALLEAENERLRKAVDFAEKTQMEYVGAFVIAREPGSWFSTFTIDRGTADGVQTGMAVVTPDGLAGVVIEAQEHMASVRAVADAYSSLVGMVERTRDQGVLNGMLSSGSSNQLEMVYLPEQADLTIGDRVLTTGLEGVYPKGLLVGTISQIARRSAQHESMVIVKPAVDFDHLEEVLVLIETEAQP